MRHPIARTGSGTAYGAPVLVLVLSLIVALLAPAVTVAQEEVAPTTTISAESSPDLDRQIEARLTSIFASLDGLESVSVDVSEGVVTLSGEVFEREAEERALEVAARTADVVSVQNELVYDQDVSRKLDLAWTKLAGRASEVLQFLPLLGVALVIFIVFWLLGRWLTEGRGIFDRVAPNVFIGDLFRLLVRIAITLIGLIVALEVADATSILGSVLGALGLAGLAVGFAIRDTVENFIASILLSLRQPFAPNDHVIIQGNEGLVLRLTSRATLLMTFDGNHIRIPNAVVYKGIITNFSRNPRRRFSFTVGVGTDVNLSAAVVLGRQTLGEVHGVLSDPPPLGQIDTLGDSNVSLRFSAWLDQRESNYSTVRSEAISRVKLAYEQAGFDMPEPIYRVNLQGGSRPLADDERAGEAAGSVQPATPAERIDRAAFEDETSPEAAALAQVRAEADATGVGNNLLDENAPRE